MSPGTSASAGTALAVAPSLALTDELEVATASSVPAGCPVVGVLTGSSGRIDSRLGVARGQLDAVGFTGDIGSNHSRADGESSMQVAVGVGDPSVADAAAVRDAAGALGRASGKQAELAVVVPKLPELSVEDAAQAVVEGVLLSRYRYDILRREPAGAPVRSMTLVVARGDRDAALAGAGRGRLMAAATMLARDLGNSPHSHLNATKVGELAMALGRERGLTVEKPGDEVHAQMKNDMSGAAATLAAMCVLRAARCRTAVTGYRMCTDNMHSGTAMALGVIILVAWIVLFAAWFLLGIPLGPDSPIKL